MLIESKEHRRHVRLSAPNWLIACAVTVAMAPACENQDEPEASTAGIRDEQSPDSLPAELASVPLAVVGNHTIDLAEYAAALARMDRFERMRYQSEDRRRQLLEEMIDVQLLAAEARRRGLDKEPETQLMIWQAYREEVYEQLRKGLPSRESFSELEVSQYYRDHQDSFLAPQAVRLAQLVFEDRVTAEQVLQAAVDCGDQCWAELVAEHSTVQPESGPGQEVAEGFAVPGDLGFFPVTGLGSQSTGDRVPIAVVQAGQTIDVDGATYEKLVQVGSKYHLVRRISMQPSRRRSLSEVEGLVRSRLLDERFESARQDLVERLQREVPVQVDEAALKSLAESMVPGQK